MLAIQEQFPPNSLLMYDVADLWNYDCIEARGIGEFLELLFAEGSGTQNSLYTVSWGRVVEGFKKLRAAKSVS